ncbi:hypothetical protein [Sinisalibacter aestuarii]|uniref:META domain-containing protein n=1 Tax=Sinisalibacter aestuarii TaxID=2949426 RepID=A0ABQ5LUK5_9RHOB|nr:hypothetical protein [Sinisalibacter aestuarii]GKY88664.1 hypothetical protein STA1M1_25330 [Sinisalibacter aestuarii]
MRRLLLALFLLIAGPAWGFETKLGTLEIVEAGDGMMAMRSGAELIELPTAPYLAFFEEQIGDWVLIILSEGGNACNGHYTWFHAVPGDMRFSPVFGTCAPATGIAARPDGALAVTMVRIEPGAPPVTYLWDGAVLREEDAPRPASGMAEGDGPDFWIGRYPFELIAAADYQDRLAAIMGAAALVEADRLIDLSSPFAVEGGWIVGAGCVKWACNSERGVVAVSRADGRVIVALTTPEDGPRLYGDPGGPLPPAIVALLAGP